MFASLGKALALIFDPALRAVVLKSVVLTLALFAALFAASEYAIHYLPTLGAPWVNSLIAWLAPVLIVMGIVLLGGPVAALFASLYLDRVAGAIEARHYPADAKAQGTPFFTGLGAGLRLAGLVFVVDLLLLPVDAAVPGVAEVLTILANGFLLGREYFELAALRHVSRRAAETLRGRHGWAVYGAGLFISVLSAIPVADLLAPLFGAALMVHLFKRYHSETHA